jgi:hypothetical protein
MTKLPWLPQVGEGAGARNFLDARDASGSEDPLGAVVETDASGFVVALATRMTEVKQETTDDN